MTAPTSARWCTHWRGITAQGQATITGTHPLFDEQVAVTGGTRAYQNARGQVRILQSSSTHAELTFHLLP
jgi:hypothetical protein